MIDDDSDPRLARLTVRLPAAELDALREAAYRARQPVAVLARQILLSALSDGKLPAPAPAAPAELPESAREVLAILIGLSSNLSQIDKYAAAAGDPLPKLAGDSGQLAILRGKVADLGIAIRKAEIADAQCLQLAEKLKGPAFAINGFARSFNERRPVPAYAFHGPLSALRRVLGLV